MTDTAAHKILVAVALTFSMTLLSNLAAEFCILSSAGLTGAAYARTERSDRAVSARNKKEGRAAKEKDTEEKTAESTDLFLKEDDKNIDYLPEIFRCPECGYEQDEDGFCPDHNKIPLVKVVSKGRDPLSPTEYDGNEDLIVDIPLKNIQFKKEADKIVATGTPDALQR